MIHVVVSGICGRTGSTIARGVASSADLVLTGGVETPGHSDVGRRLCDIWGEGSVEVVVRPDLDDFDESSFDVLVDFSIPAQAVSCAEKAAAFGKGVVIGTTGLDRSQVGRIKEAARKCPIVVGANMSVGVNLLFDLVRKAAVTLGPGFDVEVIEAHHRLKRDAPSGTALKLGEAIAAARNLDAQTALRYGRAGSDSGRKEDEIGVHSLRSGGIVGRHAVHFTSPLEEVTLAHETFSRETFALGAVRAVRFVHERPAGLYDMGDVLGLGG